MSTCEDTQGGNPRGSRFLVPRDVAGSDEDYGWKTTKISTGGLTFFVRFFRTRGNYNLEVVLKSTNHQGGLELDC